LVYCISKKPDVNYDEFYDSWKNTNGSTGAPITGLLRLEQNHCISVPDDVRSADFDSMTELWFDDIATLLEAYKSPEWKASEGNSQDRGDLSEKRSGEAFNSKVILL
jgi:hypothetical protein